MGFITEIKPNKIGLDQIRSIVTPIITIIIYYFFIFAQTFIVKRDTDKPIGYIFYFTSQDSTYIFFFRDALGFLIFGLYAFWVAIRVININGNLGNVAIAATIFGSFLVLLDLVYYLYYQYKIYITYFSLSRSEQFSISDYISRNFELLFARSIFLLFEFFVVSILFAGIYLEITKKKLQMLENELYPKS